MNNSALEHLKLSKILKNKNNENKEIFSNTFNHHNIQAFNNDETNFSLQEETGYNKIIKLNPSGKFIFSNFEYNKLYSEKITLKNLMNFPIVLKVRSSDTKKIEIGSKIYKLSANGSVSIDFKLKIIETGNNNNLSLNNSSMIKEKNNLFIFLSSELFEIKYPIEIKYPQTSKEEKSEILKENSLNNLNRLDIATYFSNLSNDDLDSSNNVSFKNSEKKIENKIEKKLIFKNENFTIKGNDCMSLCSECKKLENQILENENLKKNLKHLMEKFKDMENLIASYADLLSVSNQQNISLNISKNNFIHFNENFTIFNTYSSDKNYPHNENESDYDFDYEASQVSQESSIVKSIEKNEKFEKNQKNNFFYIDYLNKIELNFKGEKINHFYLDYDEIDDEKSLINKIKERFVELELINYKENQKRARIVIKFLEIVKNLIPKNFNQNSNKFNSSSESFSYLNENQCDTNFNLYTMEKAVDKIEKIYKNLLKFFSPLMNFNFPQIEKDLIKKISLVVQDPILSNEEIEILYKEIQNVTLISNELAHVRIENKKLILDNEIFKNEICQINSSIDEYRQQIKNLEDEMENFNLEIMKKEDVIMEKDGVIENLENEILFLKQNLENLQSLNFHQMKKEIDYQINSGNFQGEILDENNNEIFDLLNSKDKEILHLKSQLNIQEDIINNLKKVLDKKRQFSNSNLNENLNEYFNYKDNVDNY
jgi:hypothetical protein